MSRDEASLPLLRNFSASKSPPRKKWDARRRSVRMQRSLPLEPVRTRMHKAPVTLFVTGAYMNVPGRPQQAFPHA